MKISIITVAYNSSKTILETILSVQAQDYINYEHIIIDGNSKDNTLATIRNYANKNTKWISEPDKGIYDAMNKGLKMASGEVIGILNSDDFYVNSKVLSKVATSFKENNADSVYSDLAYVDASDTSKVVRYWKSGKYKEGDFLQGWMPPHPTFFVKREIYERYNSFDLRLKSAADYELMLRFIHKFKISVSYIPEVLVLMRTGGKSNQNLINRFKANVEDRLAWKLNKLNPHPFTLFLKPLRKLNQFLFNSYNQQDINQIRTYCSPPKVEIKHQPTIITTN